MCSTHLSSFLWLHLQNDDMMKWVKFEVLTTILEPAALTLSLNLPWLVKYLLVHSSSESSHKPLNLPQSSNCAKRAMNSIGFCKKFFLVLLFLLFFFLLLLQLMLLFFIFVFSAQSYGKFLSIYLGEMSRSHCKSRFVVVIILNLCIKKLWSFWAGLFWRRCTRQVEIFARYYVLLVFKLVVCCQVRGPLSCTFGKSFVPGNRSNLWYKTSNSFWRVCPFSFNTYQDLTLPVLVCLSFILFLYDARAKCFFSQAFVKMKGQRPTALQCHIFKILVFSVPPNLVNGTRNLIL